MMDRSLYGDMAFAAMLLDENHFTLYHRLLRRLLRVTRHPDRIIFLEVQPETALQRIRKRGRPCEKDITLDYLQRLADSYRQHFFALVQTELNIPVTVVPWDEEHSEESMREKARDIAHLLSS